MEDERGVVSQGLVRCGWPSPSESTMGHNIENETGRYRRGSRLLEQTNLAEVKLEEDILNSTEDDWRGVIEQR